MNNEICYKQMLTAEQLVEHLEYKGVTFNLCNKDDAIKYLRNNNNYFKLASYRKNYNKYQNGKYICLDFAYLRDLAIIDMELRYKLIQLSLDVEHYAKMKILNQVEESGEGGYLICKEYKKSLNEEQLNKFKNEINRNKHNTYCGDLFNRYQDNFPIWALLEIVPFGRKLSMYKFCAEKNNNKVMKNEYYMLLDCNRLRNATAHSICILNDLHINTALYKTSHDVSNAVKNITAITTDARNKRMSNARIQQIVTLLYIHKILVTSNGVHNKASKHLLEFVERMNKNLEYYKNNDLILANFKFLENIIDNWYR